MAAAGSYNDNRVNWFCYPLSEGLCHSSPVPVEQALMVLVWPLPVCCAKKAMTCFIPALQQVFRAPEFIFGLYLLTASRTVDGFS